MGSARDSLAAISALPLQEPVRILGLSGDQERVVSLAALRRVLPEPVRLLAGPGCVASICPESDVYQAMRLVERHPVTMLVADNLMRLSLNRSSTGARSLAQAGLNGADVRPVGAPIEAVLTARAEPQRDMVYFVAGFETLLAPLAGMVLEGLPDNLSILLCGRRAEPFVERLLSTRGRQIDALLLPGNRCALTGTAGWEALATQFGKPAVVAGYTAANLLAAIHALLRRHLCGEAQVDNLYRPLARPEGNALARDQLFRVFELGDGEWRGLGRVGQTAYRLRRAYDLCNADRRYPDYRAELGDVGDGMPEGCECASVVIGQKEPADCRLFVAHCSPVAPYGPCMASQDGACFLSHVGPGA
jgi:hydrogenase expression/formation protein HypD